VTFFAGALRADGTRALKNLVGRMRAIRDAAEIGKVLNPASANANRSRTAGSVQMARGEGASEVQEPTRGRNGKKPVRRNEKYEGIDRALREISEARPKNHEEVFQFLDDRKVSVPNRKPFQSAGGWLKGFQRDPHSASAWLSQVWGRLGLPSFRRGPKK